jgi:zinc transporter
VAVINDVLFAFENEPSDVSTMTLGVLPGAMISARLKPLRSIERLRETVKSGAPCRSPVNLLTHLLKNQADVLAELVRKSGPQVDKIEDSMLTSRIGSNRSRLSGLRRMLVRLQRLLAPEPAALFRLLNRPPAWITSEDLQELRQSAEEFALVVGDCAALVERVKLIQEELVAMVNEQTNRSVLLLTFATVLLLPFNVVGGLFGMNVGGIPFANDAAGFWVIIVIVTALTAALARLLLIRFRR